MKILLLLTVLIIQSTLFAQTGKVTGFVKDKSSGKAVEGVNIIISDARHSTTTDREGKFAVPSLSAGNYKMEFSHVGYRNQTYFVTIEGNDKHEIEIELFPALISMGEVTVSSPRYMKMIKDYPVPMVVVEKEQISLSSANTASDIISKQPGVTLARDGIWGTYISIRGLSRSNIITLVNGNRIETANDIAASLSMFNNNDIKRIEVIKGASSLLYGTGGLGGAINIITDDGGYSSTYRISGSVSSGYNTVNNARFGNLSLLTGKSSWYLRINGSLRKASDINTPAGVLKNSRFQDEYFSTAFGIKPLSNQEVKLNYQRYYGKDIGIPGGAPLFPGNADVRYPFEQRDLFSAEYIIKNISDAEVNLSLKYFNQNIYRDVENIPYIIQNQQGSGGQPPRRIHVQKILPSGRHYTNGLQIQASGIFGNNHFIIAGIDAWQRELDSRRERHLRIEVLDSTGTSVVNTINQVVGERPLPEARYLSVGLFAQDEFRAFEDILTITFGGRVDGIRVKNKEVRNPVYQIVNGVRNDSPTNKLFWDKNEDTDVSWSGTLGVLFHTGSNTDITFNAGRSFRSPSIEERFQFIDLGNLVRLGDPSLSPEKGTFVDLGLRLWNPEFTFNGSVFLNLLEDLVAEIPGTYENRNALIKTNIGKARFYGVDFSAETVLPSNIVLYGNLAYVRGEDTQNNTDLPQIAPLNGILGFRIPFLKLIVADISTSFFLKQDKVAAGETVTPGYITFDLSLYTRQIDFNSLTIQASAGVENIADKLYRNHLSSNRGFITAEPGRNIFAKVNVYW